MDEDQRKQYLLKIGNRIRNRRIALDMSQDELAKKSGYSSRSTINKIESGINDIPQSKIKAIAEALNTTVTDILCLEENHQNNPEKNTCKLFEKCHDKTTLKAVSLFIQLDQLDQGNILGRMEILLEDSKYSIQKGLKNA